MLEVLAHPIFRRLFAAQAVALLGTGLLTVALGLLAFELAGAQAGVVLGVALTIKMVAYVGLSPLAAALTAGLDRRAVLVCADLVRAAAALCLPFIDAVWQIYALIFLLQAASATFTPTFQALIPDVLPDEGDYTRALSLSRLAYDLENLLSPMLAALLLSLIAPSGLFAATALGFLGSAWLVWRCALPLRAATADRPFWARVTRGSRIYIATPRLRGLLALNWVVAMGVSVVLVQSVVIAQDIYGFGARDLAVLLGAYGLGSMTVALALPRMLEHLPDRAVMLCAGGALAGLMTGAGLAVVAFGWPSWAGLLGLWTCLGAGYAGLMTPSGRLIRRSARTEDRAAVFAAQFALSHACWLIAYPLAGVLGAGLGLPWTMTILGGLAMLGVAAARAVWPPNTAAPLEHSHSDLPKDHPHLKNATRRGTGWVHSHAFVIDDEHRVWPTDG